MSTTAIQFSSTDDDPRPKIVVYPIVKPLPSSSSLVPGAVVVIDRRHLEPDAPSWFRVGTVVRAYPDGYVAVRHGDGSVVEYHKSILEGE